MNKKMTTEEIKEFDKLYQYVKTKIMGYDENQSLSPQMVLKLKGLKCGKYIETKKQSDKADYSYKIILLTFKAYSSKISNMISTYSFKDEDHKFNFVLSIIRKHINDIYLKFKKANQQDNKMQNDDLSHLTHEHAEYKRKTRDLSVKEQKKFEEFW